MKQYLQDIIGKKFGTLTVLEHKGTNENQQNVFLCRCDCGNELLRRYSSITKTKSNSCPNCRSKYRDINQTKEFNQLHSVWMDIGNRTTKNHKHNRSCYKKHNIKMCEEWKNNFRSFYNWAIKNGYKYEKLPNGFNKYTIDRIDPYKGYYPENCRWITIQEQQRNRLDNKIIDWEGKKYKLWELADKYNIDKKLLYVRKFVCNWTTEKSLTQKVKPRKVFLEYNGKLITYNDIVKLTGLSNTTIRDRLKRGWSIEKIISTPRQNNGGEKPKTTK